MLLYILRVYVLLPFSFFAGSILTLVLLLVGFGHEDRGYFYSRFLMPFMQKVAGIKVVFRNWELLTKDSPLVIVANHQHSYDLFIQGAFIPHQTITIGKKSLRWVPIFGWIFALTNSILIDRGRHEQAIDAMKKAAQEMNLSQRNVWMFPEGTRSRDRGMLPFKKGAFYLAVAGQRPLVPVVASSIHLGLNFRKWNAGTIVIEAMEPISTQGMTLEEVPMLTQRVRDIMSAKFNALNAEVLRLKNQKEVSNV
jgi:1-acyl-sn-glycerol-3-phosphate acyltransferase